MITLVCSTGICNLMELEKLLPEHSRQARGIRKVYESLVDMAALHGHKLDDDWINIGVTASNAGMKVIAKAIKAAEPKKERKVKS